MFTTKQEVKVTHPEASHPIFPSRCSENAYFTTLRDNEVIILLTGPSGWIHFLSFFLAHKRTKINQKNEIFMLITGTPSMNNQRTSIFPPRQSLTPPEKAREYNTRLSEMLPSKHMIILIIVRSLRSSSSRSHKWKIILQYPRCLVCVRKINADMWCRCKSP